MMRNTIKNKINDASKFNKLTECFENNHLKLWIIFCNIIMYVYSTNINKYEILK